MVFVQKQKASVSHFSEKKLSFQKLLANSLVKLKKLRKSTRRKAPLGLINKFHLNLDNGLAMKIRQKLESIAEEMTKKEYEDLERRLGVLNVCRTIISKEFIEYALNSDFIITEQNGIHVYGVLAGKVLGTHMVEVELLCSADTQKRVGSHLLDLVKQVASIITLDPVESAIPFYEKQGFVMDPTSNQTMYYPSCVVDKIKEKHKSSSSKTKKRKKSWDSPKLSSSSLSSSLWTKTAKKAKKSQSFL
jgi:hypothetical protein